jgi:hypothetical protein
MKKVLFYLTLIVLISGLCQELSAQCSSHYFEYLDGNQVKARMHNSADHFWDLTSSPVYEVPKGSGKNSAFATSLWIGGLDASNTLRVAAHTYRQSGTDFFPGPYRGSGNYSCETGFTAPGNVFDRGLITLSSGKVVAFYAGGFTVYDPATNSTLSRILPVIRNEYEALELPDGRILLYGDDQFPTPTDAMIVDTTNFSTTTIGQLNFFHKRSSATVLPNGSVLIAGVSGCEVFDPVSLNSTPVSPMGTPRTRHAAILLPNGQVFVVGGSSSFGSIPQFTTELYDPTSGNWSAGPNLAIPRYKAEATLLPGGTVLITGGSNTSGDFEEFNPNGNAISTVSGTALPFEQHSVFPLASGELLIQHEGASASLFSSPNALLRYSTGNQQTDPTQFFRLGSIATPIAGNMVLVEFRANQFVKYDPIAERFPDHRWQKMWKVSRAQIDQFQQDFLNNAVNFANYPDIETWPARGDVAAGEDNYLAPFVDVNQDGQYRPAQDGDYPCIEGDQALWWAYHDDGPHTETGAAAMEIQVEQMSYVYDCSSSPCGQDSLALDHTTFHHLEITNKSALNYTDVYVGVWLDSDIGYFADDYIGTDTVLKMAFSYNGDPNDETSAGYGQNPPALGLFFLDNGQVNAATNSMSYQNDFSVQGNPTQPVHYYNYMRSRWTDGTPLTSGGNGYGGSGPGTNWIFPGDPGWCGGLGGGGWSEVTANNAPFDRRILISHGPFNLQAGQQIDLDYAVVWARGFYNDNLGSVCQLRSAAVAVDSFWQNQPQSCFNIVLDRPEPEQEFGEMTLYPNPNAGSFWLEFPEPLRARTRLEVFAASGALVHAESLPGYRRRYEVNAGQLPDGVYLVRIEGDGGAVTRKIVVQN